MRAAEGAAMGGMADKAAGAANEAIGKAKDALGDAVRKSAR